MIVFLRFHPLHSKQGPSQTNLAMFTIRTCLHSCYWCTDVCLHSQFSTPRGPGQHDSSVRQRLWPPAEARRHGRPNARAVMARRRQGRSPTNAPKEGMTRWAGDGCCFLFVRSKMHSLTFLVQKPSAVLQEAHQVNSHPQSPRQWALQPLGFRLFCHLPAMEHHGSQPTTTASSTMILSLSTPPAGWEQRK